MRKILTLLVIATLFVAFPVSGEVAKDNVLLRNVANERLLVDLLRDTIDSINTELRNAGGGWQNMGTGDVYYVDSGVGSDDYDGTEPAYAKATLDAAVGLCTANNGDVIVVIQNHTETMGAAADEVDIDVAGVTVIGLGVGGTRPLYDYTGDVTGAFAIGADDVVVSNLQFHANVTDVNEAIDIEAGSENVAIINCVFDVEAEGTDDFLECIDSPGAASDRLIVSGCQFYMGAGACNAAISFKDSDYARIVNNVTFGDYAVACINQVTTASNHILIENNRLFNGTIGGNAGLNAQPGIEVLATTTGLICNNYIGCNLATKAASVVADDCYLFENYYNEDEGGSATGGIIGAASADD